MKKALEKQLGYGLKGLGMRNSQSKIISASDLGVLCKGLKDKGHRIVVAHGVFDLLHPGHLEHFAQAATYGDVLIVSVTADEFVNKGPGRPIFNLEVRMKSLSHIEAIDYVVPSHFLTGEEVLRIARPDYYVKGKEYENENEDITGKIVKERQIVEQHGGQVVFTDGFTSSSSKLINRHISPLSEEAQKWISEFREEYKIEDVFKILDEARKLEAAVVGETIIDRYTDCTPLGKSGKYPTLVFQKHESDDIGGGVLAIASICSEIANQVNVFTHTNSLSQMYNKIEMGLPGNVSIIPFLSDNKPDILKHRFVEKSTGVRVFEYYEFSPEFFPESEIESYWLNSVTKLREQDVVITADYGHGFLSEASRRIVEENAKYLAVNTQINAGNRGFNTIAKYNRADLICLNGGELQLELRDSNPNYESIVPEYIERMKSRHAVLTLGAEGLMVFSSYGTFSRIPALSSKVIDKVGAGDSVLAISSLLSYLDAPLKVIGLVANIVAAYEVMQRGHKASLTHVDLKKSIKGILG